MSNKNLLILLISAVLIVWLATPFAISFLHPAMQERGQFGDIYGSVNALFSGLAFAGLFYTINLQIKQLRLQQAELKIQRKELRMQREEMAASRGELRMQVEMQRALITATIAQISVAAHNAEIEALKMDSETVQPNGRFRYAINIRVKAETLERLAKQLESEIPKIN
jgi:hypothetical protein